MLDDGELAQTLRLGDQQIPFAIQRNARARRITITVDHTQRILRIVLPKRTSVKEGVAFCQLHADWVINRFAVLPQRIPFEVGEALPLLGVPHLIAHAPEAKRGVWQEAGQLWVSGQADFLPRRIEAFARDLAKREIVRRAREKSALVGRPARRITLRDIRSRWGSCSPGGDLSFCWRLIFAPEAVLDYVVAHEVAHLKHMNHSRSFWAQVAELTPEVAQPRRWLVKQGATLWRYG